MLSGFEMPRATAGRDTAIGWQFAIDLHGCRTSHLDDVDWIRRTMLEAAVRADASVVSEQFHRFQPYGISGVVVIGESHLAVHVWPERRFAALDVFTCNSRLKLNAAAGLLIDAFDAREPRLITMSRGGRAIEIAERDPRDSVGPAGIASHLGVPPDDLYIDSDDASGGHWFVRDGTVATRQTPFQSVEILEFAHFGRALVIDRALQSVERDEYIYHEALVQPALCLHTGPRRVLIIGGGEGATAREVLKHPGVENVVMVDLDRELVSLAREHLGRWHQNSFDDPRLRLSFGDGYHYIAQTSERFDVIIIDLVDSLAGGPAEALYTAEFYCVLKSRLAGGGTVVVQAMECDASVWEDHRRVRGNLQALFVHARSYASFVPSFWSTWGFVLASDSIDPCMVRPEAIDAVIDARKLTGQLRFYDGTTHQGLFALSKDMRGLLGVS